MSPSDIAADARVLWRMLRGQPRVGGHAERLQGFYAPQADRYDAFRARLLHGREALIAELDIPAGARVVELGCGTGANLAALDRARPLTQLTRVHLVDLCPALLEQARRRAAGHGNIEVVEADATTWRPPAPAERVYLSYSLSMMPDWRAVLDNAQAMLAPGGRIGVVDFHLPDGRLGKGFWRAWFGHDGVRLSDEYLPALRQRFAEIQASRESAPLPYLPGARGHYYRFIGEKRG